MQRPYDLSEKILLAAGIVDSVGVAIALAFGSPALAFAGIIGAVLVFSMLQFLRTQP